MTRIQIAVLQAVSDLPPLAYAVTIKQWLEDHGHAASYGAAYGAIDYLEGLTLVRTWFGDPTPERGGRAKRFVEITELGTRTLAALARERSGSVQYVSNSKEKSSSGK